MRLVTTCWLHPQRSVKSPGSGFTLSITHDETPYFACCSCRECRAQHCVAGRLLNKVPRRTPPTASGIATAHARKLRGLPLLTQPDSPAILPHKIEPATAFPQALASALADLAPCPRCSRLSSPPRPKLKPRRPTRTRAKHQQPPAPNGGPPPDDYKIVDPNRPPTKGLTADGVTTDLVMHDWTGIVLVPLDTSISMAHTVLVALDRIEAHPLDNGQVRIWARVRNISGGVLPSEVACSFRTAESPEPERPIFYKLDIPRGDYRDVFFVSPEGRNLNSYTVLVRSGDDALSATGNLH